MDHGIADTLNRHVAELVTEFLDSEDQALGYLAITPWWNSPIGETLMGENDTTDGDRAWFIGMYAARTPGVDFDGHPADCDWENLFHHFRAAIEARRDPKTPHAEVAESAMACGVGSQ